MNRKALARRVITSLHRGIPPERGFQLYSVGHDKLINGFKRNQMNQIVHQGQILFINGSKGAGKTHFFRLLQEIAFDQNCLVSAVELKAKETPFSKLEKVFSSIVRNIQTPAMYENGIALKAEPFAEVIKEALSVRVTGVEEALSQITAEEYNSARQALMEHSGIDTDFKKIVAKYWETYVPDRPFSHETVRDERRGEALQWFSGEGTEATFRTKFEVNKTVNGATARIMLESLAGFIGFAGYRGLMILFDEATQAYQLMPPSERPHAYSNLLHLVNGIEALPGLFLVYATTPDFYYEPYGIVNYDALASRIGKPKNRPPRPMDTVWNLDKAEIGLDDYKQAALKIRDVYKEAKEDEEDDLDSRLPSAREIETRVEELAVQHGETSSVRFWRVLMPSLIEYFEDYLEGAVRPAEEVYEDVLEDLDGGAEEE